MEHPNANPKLKKGRKRMRTSTYNSQIHVPKKQRVTSSVSPLLAIPAEIRVKIFSYIFNRSDSDDPALPGTRAPDLLRPLLTCRKIYEEASVLAFSRVTFAVDCMTLMELKERASILHPRQIGAIRSVAYSNYTRTDGYNHIWLRSLNSFRPGESGIMLDEFVIRPAWEDDSILPLISREDEGDLIVMDRGPVGELAKSILATLRNVETLKRIQIYCDGLLLERDIAALHKEFRSEFRHPSFQDWRWRTEDIFQNGYFEWVQSWHLIIRDPRRWRLHWHDGDTKERSVKVEFTISDSWVGRYFPPPSPPSPASSSWYSGKTEDDKATSIDDSEESDSESNSESGGSEDGGGAEDSGNESVYSPIEARGNLNPPSPKDTFFNRCTNYAYN